MAYKEVPLLECDTPDCDEVEFAVPGQSFEDLIAYARDQRGWLVASNGSRQDVCGICREENP